METSHAPPAAASAAPAAAPRPLAVGSWVLYDLANTIFSLNVVSLYFPLWVLDAGGNDGMLGVAIGVSMLVVALVGPALGALSDSAPRRMPHLVVATLLCVAATALLGRFGLLPSLVLFAFANMVYNQGLVYYDALLPEVSTPATRGRIGGLGVAVGYVGSYLGIAMGALVLSREWGGKPTVFLATAGAFLLLAIPAFLFVKERPRPRLARKPVLTATLDAVRATREFPGLRRFLVGRFFFADAANTLIAFMGVYVTAEIGFTQGATQGVLAVGITGAILGGFVMGHLADRWGPKRALYVTMSLWVVTFAGAIAIPVLGLTTAIFWGVAALAGFSLGGTWAADRPFMLRLTPADRVGEFYGLYALAGRFASIAGPLMWALVVTVLGLGRPAAIAVLLAMMGVAMLILRKVSDAPATPTAG